MDLKLVVWGILTISSLVLIYQLLRNRQATRWFSVLALNMVIAVFFLYVLNLLEGYTHFSLPINLVTLATVGFLGIPGIVLLVGLKLVLLA
jgi:inhibitor of the pro-sigma K processing machinery